jgi:hypothetical protein
MKLTIEATEKLTTMDGVQVRLWMGRTEDGVECCVFVHRMAVHKSLDASALERVLVEQMPPGVSIPLRHIL